MPDLSLDPHTSALVLIDLQRGIVRRQTAPHSADNVVSNAVRLADAFRRAGSTVVLVHVAYAPDGGDRLHVRADEPMSASETPPGWADIVPELGPKEGDLVITKRQWGAFYGTGFDLQLRRRGIRTLVLGGIATNFGVESTARDAYERNYDQVFVEDAMSGLSAEAHTFAVKTIFPRIGLVRSTQEVLIALSP
ncbi:MAG TPA: hydrolase [Rhodothermales bacterium]|nr:hydrolase [Rhodothermales bacterium]